MNLPTTVTFPGVTLTLTEEDVPDESISVMAEVKRNGAHGGYLYEEAGHFYLANMHFGVIEVTTFAEVNACLEGVLRGLYR